MTRTDLIASIAAVVVAIVVGWNLHVTPSGDLDPGQRSMAKWVRHEFDIWWYREIKREQCLRRARSGRPCVCDLCAPRE